MAVNIRKQKVKVMRNGFANGDYCPSSILIAFAWNVFLLPHKILSSGVSGIAMIISLLTPINTGVINFALNLPLLLLGYMKLGKKFITNTILSVVVTSVALWLIPVEPISSDPILSSLFGGVLAHRHRIYLSFIRFHRWIGYHCLFADPKKRDFFGDAHLYHECGDRVCFRVSV